MAKRMESATEDAIPPNIPSQHDISKVVSACGEQTSSCDWNRNLFLVAKVLGLEDHANLKVPDDKLGAQDRIAPVVFQGLAEMLPLVQTLCEDRFISIETNGGICLLVVWTHPVRGMTVLVKLPKDREVRFGTGVEQVFIHLKSGQRNSSIALLDANGEILFHMLSDADDFEIDGANKISAKGYGTVILTHYTDRHEAAVAEVSRIIVAAAISTAKWLQSAELVIRSLDPELSRITIDDRAIISAANFLFKDQIRDQEIRL
ncbi:MAG: hypothetical protein Q9160_004141 [Pyrenula sp. 1 TL-2023]